MLYRISLNNIDLKQPAWRVETVVDEKVAATNFVDYVKITGTAWTQATRDGKSANKGWIMASGNMTITDGTKLAEIC